MMVNSGAKAQILKRLYAALKGRSSTMKSATMGVR